MAPDKGWRLGTAIGFLAGLFLCLDAVKDTRALWPPAMLWNALAHPQRLMLGGGIAVIVVSFVLSLARPTTKR